MGVSKFALYFFWRCSPWEEPARWPVAVNVLGESWDEYTVTATELLVGANLRLTDTRQL